MQRADDKDKDLKDCQSLDTNAPLFSNISNVLLTLHLLYEDSKLNKFHWKGCPTLASFLSRIAADLNLKSYVHHYWRDFPTACRMDIGKRNV